MTTNIERAAEVLRDDKHYKMGPHGEQFLTSEAARSLADAGLLMPDTPVLPEPEMKDGRTVWRVDEEGFVYIKPNGWITTVGVETPYESPSIAYRHALALIAAADHAEQEQGNG